MKRRAFLGLLASTAPVALILPELIVPKRTFFLPPAQGWPTPWWSNLGPFHQPTPAEILADIERLMKQVWEAPYAEPVVIWLCRYPGESDAEFRARCLLAIEMKAAARLA